MDKPLVTIVMPVFNAEQYIHAAVQSMLDQTLINFELIIINDGSTDRTGEVLQAFENNDSRIKLISRENKGLVYSLNQGIELAQSDLIARMDADDIALPNRLSLQIDFMQQNPDVVCAGSFYILIDEDSREINLVKSPTSNDEIQRELIKGHTVICHPTAIYRKQAVIDAGLYREQYFLVEDLDLWLRLGEKGKLANIDMALVKYRMLDNSISSNAGEKQTAIAKQVIEEASEKRGIPVDFEANKHWRPKHSKNSQFQFYEKYSWWAFNYGNKNAAQHYALKAFRLKPFHIASWRLLYCSLFRKTPS